MTEAELLAECTRRFSYDPETGALCYARSVGRIKSGTEVSGLDARGYKRVNILGKTYFAHRIIWLMKTGKMPDTIDHDNRIKTDNRWVNLYDRTTRQNNQNRVTSGLGIKTNKSGKFEVNKKFNGKSVYFGSFSTYEEASSVSVEIEAAFNAGEDVLSIRKKYVSERKKYENTI